MVLNNHVNKHTAVKCHVFVLLVYLFIISYIKLTVYYENKENFC